MEEFCRINRWEMLKRQLQNLSPEEFLTKMQTAQDTILIDCRQPNEFANSHLEGAINMDYFGKAFYEQLEQLNVEKTYLVYCRSGRRSLRTCTLMQNSGFSKVFNLEGGLKLWTEELGRKALVTQKVNDE